MTVGVPIAQLLLSLLLATFCLARIGAHLTPSKPSVPIGTVSHPKNHLAKAGNTPPKLSHSVASKRADDDLLLGEGQTLLDRMNAELIKDNWSEHSSETFALLNSLGEFECKLLTNGQKSANGTEEVQQILGICGGNQSEVPSIEIETLRKLDKKLVTAMAEMKKTEIAAKVTIDGANGKLSELLSKAKQHPKSVTLQMYAKALEVLKLVDKRMENGMAKKAIERVINKKAPIMPSELVGLVRELLALFLQKNDESTQAKDLESKSMTKKATQKQTILPVAHKHSADLPAKLQKKNFQKASMLGNLSAVNVRRRRNIPSPNKAQFRLIVLIVMTIASCAISMSAFERENLPTGSVAIVAIAHLFLFLFGRELNNHSNSEQTIPATAINHGINYHHNNQTEMPDGFQNGGGNGVFAGRQTPSSDCNSSERSNRTGGNSSQRTRTVYSTRNSAKSSSGGTKPSTSEASMPSSNSKSNCCKLHRNSTSARTSEESSSVVETEGSECSNSCLSAGTSDDNTESGSPRKSHRNSRSSSRSRTSQDPQKKKGMEFNNSYMSGTSSNSKGKGKLCQECQNCNSSVGSSESSLASTAQRSAANEWEGEANRKENLANSYGTKREEHTDEEGSEDGDQGETDDQEEGLDEEDYDDDDEDYGDYEEEMGDQDDGEGDDAGGDYVNDGDEEGGGDGDDYMDGGDEEGGGESETDLDIGEDGYVIVRHPKN